MKVRTKAVWVGDLEGANPRAKPFKDLEMSVRRAYELNSGLIDSLLICGDVLTLRESRLWMITTNKDLKSALNFGRYGSEDAACHHQDVWEWMIDHWYAGALRRSVVATMDNLTDANRKTIKGKVDELYE